jgi:hypothetical protein
MLNLYANYGKGFETPNLIEIAYDNVTTGTGPNLNLTPSQSDNYEIGAKAFANSSTRINTAIFRTNTDKEIVVASSGTYTTYQNAGKTKRQGIEASIDSQLANNFGIYGAYTFLDAKFDSTFSSAGNTVNSGNTILEPIASKFMVKHLGNIQNLVFIRRSKLDITAKFMLMIEILISPIVTWWLTLEQVSSNQYLIGNLMNFYVSKILQTKITLALFE